MASLISANRLSDGVVVYRTGDGGWTPRIEAADLVAVETAEAALATARRDEARNLVVDVTSVEAELIAGGVRAKTLRERIRAGGPTIAYGAF